MNKDNGIITSAANPAVKRLKSLALKKYRDEEGLFLVEGARHVGEALAAGWELDTVAYSAAAENDPAVKAGKKRLHVTDDLLIRITGRDNTQKLIGAFKQHWTDMRDIKQGLWVGLENIRDPGNLGTIIRSADAVAAEGVVLIGDTCDPWSPEAVRSSVGSFARIKVAKATPDEFLKWKQGWKGRVIGTHLQTKTDYRSADYSLPLLLLMGSEQSGLSPALTKACDTLVKIPMQGGAESLNLAVATGIMLYEIRRGRM